MKQKCLGCKEECEMDAPDSITGCVYADGIYPKDAEIWYNVEVLTNEEDVKHCKDRIQYKYPTEWGQEEH